MSQEDVETLSAVYERWGRGDFWTPEVFDPDVEVVWNADMPDTGTYHGLAGLEEGVREFFKAWDEVASGGRRDRRRRRRECSCSQPLAGGGAAAGSRPRRKFAHVWTMRDGKATRIAAYTNRLEALRAVGLSADRPPAE